MENADPRDRCPKCNVSYWAKDGTLYCPLCLYDAWKRDRQIVEDHQIARQELLEALKTNEARTKEVQEKLTQATNYILWLEERVPPQGAQAGRAQGGLVPKELVARYFEDTFTDQLAMYLKWLEAKAGAAPL